MKQYWIPTLTVALLTASVGTWAHMAQGQEGAHHPGPVGQGMHGQDMPGRGMHGHGMHMQGMHLQGTPEHAMRGPVTGRHSMHAPAMGAGPMSGMQHQHMSPMAGHMRGMSTPEMRALQEEMRSKMQAAKTPEERQALMTQQREKMHGLMHAPAAPAAPATR